MSDLVDNANDTAQYLSELAVADARSSRDWPEASGHCLNCGEPLNNKRRWCDKDCASDWEKLNKRGVA
ncbi:DUF2116 family Zn-ribbon domain-containing protein [Idiomarina sp.]|uniref:DUF2116 family Zn-ribbon domain-containing protein n=1 Tax=Idiomarina sp. TaxID=1874361 RepID=UPI0025B83676|nr:DUF2116 family Zn-ribbon domain-containing protein [Idiomarina sp.]